MDYLVLYIFLSVSLFLSLTCYALHYLLVTYDSWVHRERREKDLISRSLLAGSLTFMWYAISITFTIYNKWLMGQFYGGFKFPLLSTSAHMFIKFVFSRLWFWNEPVDPVASNSILVMVILVGCCTAADVALSNESIVYLSLTLYTTIKATVLVFTFMWAVLLGVEKFRCNLFASVMLISAGIGVAVLSTVSYSVLGLIMCLTASILGALRWTLLQMIMKLDPNCSRDVFVTLYHFSPYSVLFIAPIALWLESERMLASTFWADPHSFRQAMVLVAFGGLISFVLIVVEVQLVKVTSSLTMSVLGQIKEVTQIGLSMIIFKDSLTVRGMLGIFLSLMAAEYYRYIKMSERRVEFADMDAAQAQQSRDESEALVKRDGSGSGSGSGSSSGSSSGDVRGIWRKSDPEVVSSLNVFDEFALNSSSDELYEL